jgi:hypothetical protein
LRQNTFPSEQHSQLLLLLVSGSFRLKFARCCYCPAVRGVAVVDGLDWAINGA